MRPKPKSIDDYLATVGDEQRRALVRLRKEIHRVVPDTQECISYQMPAFRFQGRVVAGIQATITGCSYYPFSGSTLSTLADELRGYSKTKSALHFSKPLPAGLVRKLLKARIAELKKR